MNFSYGANNKIKLDLVGAATNYDALSKQSDAFGAENLRKFISQPVISDFNPIADGSISFNFTAMIDPRLISYDNTVVTTPTINVISTSTNSDNLPLE